MGRLETTTSQQPKNNKQHHSLASPANCHPERSESVFTNGRFRQQNIPCNQFLRRA
jgi:hypothetical protein